MSELPYRFEDDGSLLPLFSMLGPEGTVEFLLSGRGTAADAREWLEDTTRLLDSPPLWVNIEDYLAAFKSLTTGHTDESVRSAADRMLQKYTKPVAGAVEEKSK